MVAVEMAPHLQFQVHPLPTLVVVAAALLRLLRLAPAVRAVVAPGQIVAWQPLAQLILAAAVVGQPILDRQQAVLAALASLSSSTTSALPRSLPSSHRRSGLHQRVR
jgi:hypothetical protein